MKKYSLIVGSYESDRTFVVDDLMDVNQLYGALRIIVKSGYRLVDVCVSDYD